MIIVEDDPDIASLEAEALSGVARVTLITNDFHRALRPETWLGVDVAVVDLMLPELDGEDICRYLAFEHPQVRRIICTAKPITQLVEVSRIAHVVLHKPFSVESFVDAVMGEVS